MAKNNKKNQCKQVPPRTSDVKDITMDVSAEVDLNILDSVFESAVVELGRQISKRYNNSDASMAAVKFVSDLHNAIKEFKKFDGWGARTAIATELGYNTNAWDANGCGSNNVDFGDLYEKSEVHFAIAFRKAAKPVAQLRKLGTR
jgi:hypothetical protein